MLGRPLVVANVVCALLAFSPAAWAQATVKAAPMRPIASVNGKDVYKAYCAGCHGDDLKGNGPLSAGMKVRPSDLTTIAVRHDGQFVTANIENYINGWNRVPRSMADVADRQRAIETGENTEVIPTMPAFGPIFARLYPQEVRDRQIRMANLLSYLKSQQVKSAPADPSK